MLKPGDIILLTYKNKNIDSLATCNNHIWCWNDHPEFNGIDYGNCKQLCLCFDQENSVILVVVDSIIKTKYHYWLRCLHPSYGPITLDQIDKTGYQKAHADYTITLCE